MKLSDLLQIAGILFGFQLTIFSFRLTRELTFIRKKRWIPIPDLINLISILIMVIFLFLYPMKNIDNYDIKICMNAFGLSVLLFALYPFLLLGHYDLFTKSTKRKIEQDWVTKQEIIVLCVSLILIITYFLV